MMSKEEFKKLFAEEIAAVEVEDIHEETNLDDLDDWDSMAVVVLNTALDENYGFTLGESEIKQLNVYGDIVNFIEKKVNK